VASGGKSLCSNCLAVICFNNRLYSIGTRTLCHYDHSHNMFSIISGVLRVVLFAPSTPGIQLFPYVHPYAMRTVRDVLTLDQQLQGFEAMLEAGDVLYIPPYWLHDVTTLQLTIALSIWSHSRDDGIADALLALGVPAAKGHASLQQQLRAAFLFVAVSLDAAFPDRFTAAQFIQTEMFERRFDAITSGASEFDNDTHWMKHHCPVPESPIGRYSRARAAIPNDRIARAIALVLKIPEASRMVVLGNYVELLFNELSESRGELIPTMLYCFVDWLG
jgi:hypothetical protein